MKQFRIFIILGATILLSTLAIDASDTLSGKGGTLLAQLTGYQTVPCPSGMTHVPAALTFTCVDTYEASPGPGCPFMDIENQFSTEVNIDKQECRATSETGRKPWVLVSREQAVLLCTRAGKRLPSAAEWYQFALGTPADSCNVRGEQAVAGGEDSSCRSAAGVVHAVGNVWEWVGDDIIDGAYLGRNLPDTGYVTQVDAGGVATVTVSEKPPAVDGYLWSAQTGSFGLIRGGFYGSKADAGVYTIHAETVPTFVGAAVGFRCVQ
jgi:formylglycine-generating enzyme required for sulfatase activity